MAFGRAAQDGHDDAEADHHFGGGDDHHEEHGGLAADVAELAGQRDEREVHGVEHQLDAHEHHQRVAAHHHADDADGEQHRGQQQVPGGAWVATAAITSATVVLCELARLGSRASSTVPTTAMTSSTEVSSKASTWSLNRSRASCRMLRVGVAGLGGDVDAGSDAALHRVASPATMARHRGCRAARRRRRTASGSLHLERLDAAGSRPCRRRAA